jgi:hypothetical protein
LRKKELMTHWKIRQVSTEPEQYMVSKKEQTAPGFIELGVYQGELHAVMVEMADQFAAHDLVDAPDGLFPVLPTAKTGRRS